MDRERQGTTEDMSLLDGFVLELVPHCASVPPDGWTADHAVRPLSDLGHQQAEAMVPALGTDMEAIYSSPALRCRQTVQPLADAVGLPIVELAELLDTRQWAEPREWTQGPYRNMAQAVAGSWTAGHGLRALMTMVGEHPAGRVVAASHGDIIPAFLAMFCAWQDTPLPPVAGHGGWHTIRFTADSLTVTTTAPPTVS